MVLEDVTGLPCSVLPAPISAAPMVVWEGASAHFSCAVWSMLLGFAASVAVAPLRAAAAVSLVLAPAVIVAVVASVSDVAATAAALGAAVAFAAAVR